MLKEIVEGNRKYIERIQVTPIGNDDYEFFLDAGAYEINGKNCHSKNWFREFELDTENLELVDKIFKIFGHCHFAKRSVMGEEYANAISEHKIRAAWTCQLDYCKIFNMLGVGKLISHEMELIVSGYERKLIRKFMKVGV